MLTLFPFELEIYRQHNVPVICVGHMLADDIALETDQQAAKKSLAIPKDVTPRICHFTWITQW